MERKRINVLHVCKYYIGNKLYTNLFTELSKNEIKQTAYIPVSNNKYINRNYIDVDNIKLFYRKTQNSSDRILYFKKIFKTLHDLEKTVNVNDYNIIHSHSLFTDGGVVYQLNKKYNIPYIVSVRNTDINVFLKYFLHLRKYMLKILLNAEKVVFISPAFLDKLMTKIPKKYKKEITDKIIIIPNGMNNKWINNILIEPKSFEHLSLVQVGSLDKNKNFLTTLKVVKELSKTDESVMFNIIGSGQHSNRIKKYIKHNKLENHVVMHGHIKDVDKMRLVLDNSQIFILPSKKETFGIVYIEAISRGLPIIYSRGQGIDGFFEEGHIGYSVKYNSIEEISSAIKKIKNNYSEISSNCLSESYQFNWHEIALKYKNIYDNID